MSIGIVAGALFAVFVVAYLVIGRLYKDSVKITVRQTLVSIERGDIFSPRF